MALAWPQREMSRGEPCHLLSLSIYLSIYLFLSLAFYLAGARVAQGPLSHFCAGGTRDAARSTRPGQSPSARIDTARPHCVPT